MPSIIELVAGLTSEMDAYHVASDTETRRQLDARAAKIKAMRDAVNAGMRDGANACECGAEPHVMVKTPEIIGAKPAPPVYECGCLACGKRSRHWTREGAIEKWNKGELC